MSENLCKRVRRAAHLGRARAESLLIGEYPVSVKGLGLEYVDLREYCLGDDYRRIDWRASARIGLGLERLFVKEFREERRARLVYLLDLTASMRFKRKFEALAFTVAFHARVSEALRDEVAVITLSDRVRVRGFSRPAAAVIEVLRAACEEGARGALDLGDALQSVIGIARGKPLAVYTDYANTVESFARIAKAALASGGSVKFYVFATPGEKGGAGGRWQLPLSEPELGSLITRSLGDFSIEVKKHVALVRSVAPPRSIVEVPATGVEPPLTPLLLSYLSLRAGA